MDIKISNWTYGYSLSKSLVAVQLIADPQPGLEIAVEVATANPIEARQKDSPMCHGDHCFGLEPDRRPEGWREKVEYCKYNKEGKHFTNIANRVECPSGNLACFDPEKHKHCMCRVNEGTIHGYTCFKEWKILCLSLYCHLAVSKI